MKLPHLDQLVPLERGEAGLLARALEVWIQHAFHRPPMRATDALLITPALTLVKRLWLRHRQERLRPPHPGKRPAARPVRVCYDEMAMMHLNQHALLEVDFPAEEVLQLRVILGKFHQKALNLAQYIQFA